MDKEHEERLENGEIMPVISNIFMFSFSLGVKGEKKRPAIYYVVMSNTITDKPDILDR